MVLSKDLKKTGDIWVCPNPDNVCTRFFFVYDERGGHNNELDTRNADFRKEIDFATAHIGRYKKRWSLNCSLFFFVFLFGRRGIVC